MVELVIKKMFLHKIKNKLLFFIKGFNEIYEQNSLANVSLHDLDYMIAGKQKLNIKRFKEIVDICDSGEATNPDTGENIYVSKPLPEFIKRNIFDVIEHESKKNPKYLNNFLYLITGSLYEPIHGFDKKPTVMLVKNPNGNFCYSAHTCFNIIHLNDIIKKFTLDNIKEGEQYHNAFIALLSDTAMNLSKGTDISMAGGFIQKPKKYKLIKNN